MPIERRPVAVGDLTRQQRAVPEEGPGMFSLTLLSPNLRGDESHLHQVPKKAVQAGRNIHAASADYIRTHAEWRVSRLGGIREQHARLVSELHGRGLGFGNEMYGVGAADAFLQNRFDNIPWFAAGSRPPQYPRRIR
ncbi:hypothetical protein [Streptomyces sp. CoH17]|uniref:hypothetical protein n=1 Tax=Streptomyces sp. CoH17 TaxID=2992806 RepID=UPI00226F4926|nr:hypothetical protein [Streptomyces sp. CoH17]